MTKVLEELFHACKLVIDLDSDFVLWDGIPALKLIKLLLNTNQICVRSYSPLTHYGSPFHRNMMSF
jgi:hypothetical protein